MNKPIGHVVSMPKIIHNVKTVCMLSEKAFLLQKKFHCDDIRAPGSRRVSTVWEQASGRVRWGTSLATILHTRFVSQK